jgi:hypothetical protein
MLSGDLSLNSSRKEEGVAWRYDLILNLITYNAIYVLLLWAFIFFWQTICEWYRAYGDIVWVFFCGETEVTIKGFIRWLT